MSPNAYMGPGIIGGMSSVGIFLMDASQYLRKFRRKPRKTPKDLVDKRDRKPNPAPPVFQVLSAERSATGKAAKYRKNFVCLCERTNVSTIFNMVHVISGMNNIHEFQDI